jgi:trans-2,3-dihydro-3-hydroxyanthranilate isomerase
MLHLSGGEAIAFTISQGVEMARPSLLAVTARREPDGIRSTVAGRCVPVLRGETQ